MSSLRVNLVPFPPWTNHGGEVEKGGKGGVVGGETSEREARMEGECA